MRKKLVYEINTSSLDKTIASLNEIREELGNAAIRDIHFSQDIHMDPTRRIISTDFAITLESE